MKFNLPKAVIAELTIYPVKGIHYETVIEADSGLELEIKINDFLAPTDRATIELLRGNYQGMFLYPKNNHHEYFMGKRPSLLDSNKTVKRLVKCAA